MQDIDVSVRPGSESASTEIEKRPAEHVTADNLQPAPKDERDRAFIALYNAARQMRAAGRPFEEVIAAYEHASNAAPHRAEALHAASTLCREHGKNAEGREYARRGLKIPPPTDGLYLEPWVYDYGLLDELSVNAYWDGHYQDSLDACLRLLSEGKMPSDMHGRVAKNTQFSAEKIRQLAGSRRTGKGATFENAHAQLMEIHVINLDRSVERFSRFKERNAHLDKVYRVSAVDGALVDKNQLLKDGLIAEGVPYSPGALGCAISHINLWRNAVEQNRIITIFEDDVVCSLHFADETARLLSNLPEDWDLIKWGSILYRSFSWVDFVFSKVKLEFYGNGYGDDLTTFQRAHYSCSAIRLAHSFGNMGYSISPKGAQRLLDYCLPLRKRFISFPGAGVVVDDLHIDIAMCGVFSSMQAFTSIPPLVIHDEKEPSDREKTDKSHDGEALTDQSQPSLSESPKVGQK